MGRLNGKVALITGAAKGIGAATATAFVREGATVWLGDIDAEVGAETAAALGEAARFLPLDVTDEGAWEAAAAAVEGAHGELHVLVNNAGGGVVGNVEDMDLATWRFVHALNVESVMLGAKHCLPLLRAAGGGSIVNLSSVAGIVGDPNMPAYCSAKGAVRMLTKSLALHCARQKDGVRVNSVHPSFTDTPLVQSLVNLGPNPEETRRRLERAAPLGRLGQPEEVASMILYLASDESRYVTGAELVIDGGLTAR